MLAAGTANARAAASCTSCTVLCTVAHLLSIKLVECDAYPRRLQAQRHEDSAISRFFVRSCVGWLGLGTCLTLSV